MNIPFENAGWIENPEEVKRIVSTLPIPMVSDSPSFNSVALDENKTILLSDNFKKVTGKEQWCGPQEIGDCVSMGYAGGVEDLQIGLILDLLNTAGLFKNKPELLSLSNTQPLLELGDVQDILKANNYVYEDIATESIYGFSRCEVGGQWGSRSDGSVGAWAAKAVNQYGVLKRSVVGAYSGARAKKWGSAGVPDEFEPEAKLNIVKETSLVKSFEQAAKAIQLFKPVIVCSNRGFTMTRDAQGFCGPKGTWNHCMRFMGVRWDRPGLLCAQSWGKNSPNGPTVLNQPTNTFWVDANVADFMLRQDDSFILNNFVGYTNNNLLDWSF